MFLIYCWLWAICSIMACWCFQYSYKYYLAASVDIGEAVMRDVVPKLVPTRPVKCVTAVLYNHLRQWSKFCLQAKSDAVGMWYFGRSAEGCLWASSLEMCGCHWHIPAHLAHVWVTSGYEICPNINEGKCCCQFCVYKTGPFGGLELHGFPDIVV